MLNCRFIVKMLGSIFIIESIFMAVATAVSLLYAEDDLCPLAVSFSIILCAGLSCHLLGRKADEQTAGYREAMLTVALTWLSLSLFGMLPYLLGSYLSNIADAYFETMSGFTTTGATCFVNVENLPHGILLWRSMTQWQGGIGVVVFTVAMLPVFGGGAMQMFDAEVTGSGLTHEKIRPRVTQIAKRLSAVYLILTVSAAVILSLGPMNIFDAINHALSTVSTGGYSTKNAGLAYWNSAYLDYIEIFFMFAGSINVNLLYFLFMKGNYRKLASDEEFRYFVFLIAIFTAGTMIWLFHSRLINIDTLSFESVESSFRMSVFHVISILSSTGFATVDYIGWGSFFCTMLFILMFIGGCSGSTSGGLKVGRFIIIRRHLANVFRRQMHSSAIIALRMNGHTVSPANIGRILAFTILYIALIFAGSLALTLQGINFEESIAASLSAISNIGPGLGRQGPSGNYADLSSTSKWILSFLMMTGRLELFTVLALFMPGFWKN